MRLLLENIRLSLTGYVKLNWKTHIQNKSGWMDLKKKVDPVTNKNFYWDLGAGQLTQKEKFGFKWLLQVCQALVLLDLWC